MAARNLMHVSPVEFLEALMALRRESEERFVDGLIRQRTKGEPET